MSPKRTGPAKKGKSRSPKKNISPGSKEIRESAISYLKLRSYIGWLAISLPFVMYVGGKLFFQQKLLFSISAYYYTDMRTAFVGALWAIGFFLFSYRGYEAKDTYAGIFAGLCAIGISIFPTTPDGGATSQQQMFGIFHFIFALLFFITLIYFSIFLFRKTDPERPRSMTDQKIKRNKLYLVCGVVMFVCIMIGGTVFSLPGLADLPFTHTYHPVYWFEAGADIAFGVSWITKDGAIWADEKL